MTLSPAQLDEKGKAAYQSAEFEEAAAFFSQAAEGYALANDSAANAEVKNNMSVALLQAGKYQEALDAALGTEKVFESISDVKRQAMAFGNQAAALEALGREDEALAAYERSAGLFAQVNEDELRSLVLKSIAAIKLKRGKFTESAFDMMGSLNAKSAPNLFERILMFFLRLLKK